MEKQISIEKMALCYTHIIYRNTIIEDYHASNTIMNDDLYNVMIKEVKQKIHYIKSSLAKMHKCTAEQLQEIMQTKKFGENDIYDFIMDYNFNLKMGYGWDEPKLLTLPKNIEKIEEYILDGEF